MQIQMVPSGNERIFTVVKIFIDTNIFFIQWISII